mmetsp:Transcript_5797/g.8928  ORF Transcript_5797/g.8928 Transcript_5797/m.8928 type:complete len:177 (+) Transcript_5797:534-1064(+)
MYVLIYVYINILAHLYRNKLLSLSADKDLIPPIVFERSSSDRRILCKPVPLHIPLFNSSHPPVSLTPSSSTLTPSSTSSVSTTPPSSTSSSSPSSLMVLADMAESMTEMQVDTSPFLLYSQVQPNNPDPPHHFHETYGNLDLSLPTAPLQPKQISVELDECAKKQARLEALEVNIR